MNIETLLIFSCIFTGGLAIGCFIAYEKGWSKGFDVGYKRGEYQGNLNGRLQMALQDMESAVTRLENERRSNKSQN